MRTQRRTSVLFPAVVLFFMAVVAGAMPAHAQDGSLGISWDHPVSGASMCTTGLATGWVVVNGSGARTGTLMIDGAHVLDHNPGPGPTRREGSYHWNASVAESGTHTFVVTIADETGATSSDTLVIHLKNPTPAITSPASGATVSGTVPVSIVTDDLCSTHDFTLLVDGVVVGTKATGDAKTATIDWNTSAASNGAHQLTAQVTGDGVTKSTTIPITVQNGGTGDTTPPTAAITSPKSGVWTGNSIEVRASATDDVKLARIQLWGNGAVFGTIPCTGASCSGAVRWQTGALPRAAYEVQAVATDAAGNRRTSAKIVIYKDAKSPVKPSGAPQNGGTTTPPAGVTAHFSSPVNGASLSGPIEIAMAAGNTQGTPTRFVLKLDNATVLSDQSVSGAAASFVWNTAMTADGPHTLNLTVTDGSGRTATAAVSVTVANGGTPPPTGGDTTKPTVSITSPQNGDWTGNSIDVTATASDNAGLASLRFFGNGTQFAQVSCGNAKTCSSTEWWVTGSLPSGRHTITVVATDTAGNETTSAPVSINK